MNYSEILTPFKIGNMEVKNRIVMSPMAINASHSDGSMSDDEIRYYEERARGGTGMIIVGAMFLTKEIAQTSLQSYLDNPLVLPQLTNLSESVHKYGTKLCAQLSCGTGRNTSSLDKNGNPPLSASAIPTVFNPNIICRELTIAEINEIIKQFAYSAKLVKDASFDSIEIHAHSGYLIDQFMSPLWNKREDEYGGSLENRMRFPIEIVKSIRNAVGQSMPIIFRIALEHKFQGGRTLEESIPMLKILEDTGVDALDVDCGSYETMEYIFPPAYLGDACMEYICKEARKAVSIPILNSGNHTPETGERLLESGNADFVMMGRPLIAEPDIVNKLMMNKRDEIRPCIRCNEECIGRIFSRFIKTSCSVNPIAGFEGRTVIEKAADIKNVVIIGGGPAGLEAARTAAIRGHNVSLYEKGGSLGGQIAAAATPSFKTQLVELIKWYNRQMELLNVDVHLNSEISSDSPKLQNADAIIVAAGAIPIVPKISGIENSVDIITAHIEPEKLKGNKIAFCGGGMSACDSALEAAINGKDVTIIEMLDNIAGKELIPNKMALIPMLMKNKVKIITGHKVLEVKVNGVNTQKSDGSNVFIDADTVVSAFGMIPDSSIADEIKEIYKNKVFIIGDCNHVGKCGDAIRAGMFAAISI